MLFVKTFLLSYQSFTTPDKLLHKLIERYNVVRPDEMGLQQFDAIRTTIQVCISLVPRQAHANGASTVLVESVSQNGNRDTQLKILCWLICRVTNSCY